MRAWVVALLVGVATLPGCGWMSDDEGFFVDRTNDYVEAQAAAPLEVPERLSAGGITAEMAVPDLPPDANRHVFGADVPKPEAIYAREEAEGVRIQKLGERRWLLVPQSPAVVWPKVRQFFADNGVAIVAEDADIGRLDTDWLAPADAETTDVVRLAIKAGREAANVRSGRDRIKIRVEQGIRERTTEVHVRYENDSTRQHAEGVFPEASDNVEVEAEIIGEIGSYVASDVGESVSFVAGQISTQAKSEIVRTADDRPALRLALDFNRAWALVNQSLGDAGVPVLDVDRSAGIVYAEINEDILRGEEGKKGWFTRLVTRDEKPRPVEVHLRDENGVQQVMVYGSDGAEPLDADEAEQLLLLIREYAT